MQNLPHGSQPPRDHVCIRSKRHGHTHMGMERQSPCRFGAATQVVETAKDLPTLHRHKPLVQPAGELESPRPVSVGRYRFVVTPR